MVIVHLLAERVIILGCIPGPDIYLLIWLLINYNIFNFNLCGMLAKLAARLSLTWCHTKHIAVCVTQ